MCGLFFAANTKPADAVATLGASASTGIVYSNCIDPPKPEYSVSSIRRVNP